MRLWPKRGHLENAKNRLQSAKLRNPDLVGMGVLAVASFSIPRILYLLDVYYTSKTVVCQVNSSLTADYADCADWDRFKPRRHQGTGARDEGRRTKGERGQWGIWNIEF